MKFNKSIALLCAAAIALAAAPHTVFNNADIKNTIAHAAADSMSITKQGGSFEAAYAEWTNTASTAAYTVTYKSTEDTAEHKADTQLIRRYADHYRVDIPGLKAGTYSITIKDSNGNSVTSENITVTAHKREGFAFSKASPNGGNASGGYNSDGTLPSDAQVIYITQENVNNVKADIGGREYTGLCNILTGISNATKKVSNPPHFVIRIIGELDGSKINFDGNSDASRQVFYAQDLKNLTIEGIGEDTVLKGCAFLFKSCSNAELRNIAEMLFLDDGIAIEDSNSNIWVHNNDIFYGKDLSPETGDGSGDSDQVKGDGSLDLKKNTRYCTLSYNHFWDSGKASLVIASAKNVDDGTSCLSYHHNWFDHSDSRHPRIRMATVHMYNNYFDGNSKYGTGVTSGASAFVEANYYRGTDKPMLSSMQGSDSGTFSKEAGGIIKAYNNYIDGKDNTIYYSSSTGSDFDAYLASSRDEQVPADVKTKKSSFASSGKTYTYNNTYNNFDTDASMYSYTPDKAEDIKDIVTSGAGRINGGDIKFKFTEKDDSDHDVNRTLKEMLNNYESPIVQKYSGKAGEIYPATDSSQPIVTDSPATESPTPTAGPTDAPTDKPTDKPTAKPTMIPSGDITPVTEKITWTFEDAAAEYSEPTVYNNAMIYAAAGKEVTSRDAKFTEGATVLGMGGSAQPGVYRCIGILPGVKGKLTVKFENTSSSERVLRVWDGADKDVFIAEQTVGNRSAVLETEINDGSMIYIGSKSGGLYIVSITFEPSEMPTEQVTEQPSEKPSEETTEQPSEKPSEEVTEQPSEKPSEEITEQPSEKPSEEVTEQPSEEPTESDIDLSYNEGVVTAEMYVDAESAQGYIAQYDENGRLVGIEAVVLNEKRTTVTDKHIKDAAFIKAFIWDNKHKPLLNAKSMRIK